MRICLVNAPVLAVLEPWYDTPTFGRTGLAYLAGYLRQFDGYDITIIDAKFQKLTFTEVVNQIKELKPDLVGFTAYTNEIKPAAYLAQKIKKELPNCITVIGGPHVTAIPKETLLEFSSFDLGVIGEGEVTFHELCDFFSHNSALRSIHEVRGIVIRNENGISITSPRDRILDQDSIPFPAWDLLPKAKTYFIQSVRGCPLNCIFCMNPNGRVARKRSPENVIRELRWVVDAFKPERISFGDELFSVDIPRTHELLQAMAAERIGDKVRWDVQTHVHFVNKALFDDFKKAKVERVELGIETGDADILRKMGKGTTLTVIEEACDAAKAAGVKIGSFFLFGQPNETLQSINRTIDLAVKINPDLPMFGLMTPYPGTEVAKMAAKGQGGYKIISTDWDEYNKQIGGALEFAGMDRTKIEWIQVKAYAKVYLYNLRFVDFIKFVYEYRTAAWSVLRKIIRKQKSMLSHASKPEDYDSFFNLSKTRFLISSFTTARDEWDDYQRKELKRVNREKFNNR